MKITHCRYCKALLREILSLGTLPLVNYFPKPEEAHKEKRYPLNFVVCAGCGLAQVDYIVPAADIFGRYYYTTGASKPLVKELGELADGSIQRFQLTPRQRVLDIGSNDGTLLGFFQKKGVGALGVEPSRMLARIAKRRGVPTVASFFNRKIARKIKRQYGQFDVIFATHVLANIIDLSDFLHGVTDVLAPDGAFIVEVGYLGTMLARGQFDSIYHEHYSYFSLAVIARIFADNGLTVVEASFPAAQGGSLRVVALHTSEVSKEHTIVIDESIRMGDYEAFASKAENVRGELRRIMGAYKGKTVVGFGAPAKAVTLLTYCGIGSDLISYIVDSTPAKQGRVLPGLHIPIEKESALKRRKPDVVVILAWNYQDAIVGKLKKLLMRKTTVIVPFPELRIHHIEP